MPVVLKLKDTYDFEIVLQKNHFGRGELNAIKTGFRCAQADKVLVTMADLSDSLSIVDKMVALMDAGCDVVCASRYMKGGKQVGGPLLKITHNLLIH